MSDRIRIAVIDDHPLFREGVVQVLRNASDMEVMAEGASAQDAVRIGRTLAPDIILLDVSMPGEGEIEAARHIRQTCDAVKTVILTASENADHVSAALRSGVNGYILKGSSGTELLKVVRAVRNAELYLTSPLVDRDPSHLGIHDNQSIQSTETALTCREELTLTLLSQGLTNGEIAQKLDLTETTIKHSVLSICQKLSVRNRVEAMLTTRRRINWGF